MKNRLKPHKKIIGNRNLSDNKKTSNKWHLHTNTHYMNNNHLRPIKLLFSSLHFTTSSKLLDMTTKKMCAQKIWNGLRVKSQSLLKMLYKSS